MTGANEKGDVPMNKTAGICLVLVFCATLAFAAGVVLQPVESSLIAKAGYDVETQTMAVEMVSNADTYYYSGVPQSVYDGFMAAESKGAYFVEYIKGKYEEDLAK
jgi:hypothetical protein